MTENDDDFTPDIFADIPEAEDTDMGSDLAEAFAAHEDEAPEQLDLPGVAPVEPAAPDAPEPSEPTDQTQTEPPAEVAAEPAKPPQSWGAAEREHWANLDPAVQAQVQKRESEIQNVMNQSAESKHFYTEFINSVAPYDGLMRAQNVAPLDAVKDLMGTAAELLQGTAESKAETVANIIEQYGIDVATLDTALSGRINNNSTAGANEPEAGLKNYLSEQLAPMQQFMQNQQAQQANTQQAQYQTEQQNLQSFMSSNEFAGDLLEDMSDMMNLAANRNETMDYQQAYDKALMLRPDIQQILQQRQGGQAAAQNNQAIQQKQSATVSIPRAGASQAIAPEPTDMRSALEQAFGGQ
jgi:hypothetical protein